MSPTLSSWFALRIRRITNVQPLEGLGRFFITMSRLLGGLLILMRRNPLRRS
ncbi:hypothetical protein LINPERHAP1_LOCUS30163 [Linum perenne]